MFKTGRIYGINGPVIYLKGNTGFCMSEMVYVGREKLVGEVIALDKDMTTIQVYEETSGLRPGEEVIATGNPVSVTLAPGILNNIFDGIERPLERIAESGERLSPAVFPLTLWIKRKNGPPTSPFLWETISTAEIFSQKYPKLTRSRINVWYRLIWKEP